MTIGKKSFDFYLQPCCASYYILFHTRCAFTTAGDIRAINILLNTWCHNDESILLYLWGEKCQSLHCVYTVDYVWILL